MAKNIKDKKSWRRGRTGTKTDCERFEPKSVWEESLKDWTKIEDKVPEDWGRNTESSKERNLDWFKSEDEVLEDWGRNTKSLKERNLDWFKSEDFSKNVERRGKHLEYFPEISKCYTGNVEGRNTKVCDLEEYSDNEDDWSRKVYDWRTPNVDRSARNTYWRDRNSDYCRDRNSDYWRARNVADCCATSVNNWSDTNVDNKSASKNNVSTLDENLKILYQTKGTSTENSECLWLSKGVSTLSQNFKNLYRSQRYTDVTIKVQNKEYRAHKLVLITRSDVFASMFEHDTSEKKSGVVEIPDCDPHSFEDFLLYLYTGELEIVSSSTAVSLYKTADKYSLVELQEECVRCMLREITVDSFCHIFHLAAMYDISDLLSVATNFFISNASAILTSKEWLTLLEEHPSLCNELLVEFAKSGQQT